MLLDAISEFDLDPQLCILIGDNEADIRAGLAAKIGTNILLSSPKISLEICSKKISRISSLKQAIPFLMN